MKVTIKKPNVEITSEGKNHFEIFKELASLEEVFSEDKCGKCNSPDIYHVVRKAESGKKEYDYPELRCRKCGAKFSFGQSEGGALFPIRFMREGKEYLKDENGKYIPRGTRGWVKFNKETNKEE